jgi:hypothetical protein
VLAIRQKRTLGQKYFLSLIKTEERKAKERKNVKKRKKEIGGIEGQDSWFLPKAKFFCEGGSRSAAAFCVI